MKTLAAMEDRNRIKNGKLHPSGIKAEHGNNSEIVKFFSGTAKFFILVHLKLLHFHIQAKMCSSLVGLAILDVC